MDVLSALQPLMDLSASSQAALAVVAVLAWLTSPLAVLQIAFIVLKIPYHCVRVLLGLFFPFLFAKDVSNETVLITGGGGGIGSLMALEFASLGAKHVALMDINEEALAKTKADVEKVVKEKGTHTQVTTIKADLSEEAATSTAMKQLTKQVGNVTILINNAGIVTGQP